MTKTLSLGSRLPYPITISKLLRSPGDELKKREPLFEYKFKWMKQVGDSFRDNTWQEEQTTLASWDSPTEGKLKEWRIKEGDTIHRDEPCLVVEEACGHDIQFQGLCAMCGKDMTEVDWSSEKPDSSRATINMTHDNTGLTVSSGLAQRVEHASQRRLLDQRKLSLVVDLDQTIIHACIEPTIGEWRSDPTNPNYEAVKDVKSFQLNDDGPRGLTSGAWYYIKLRPGLAEFLEAMADMYEMHVYTMGTRAYALNIAKLIDPDMKYFGNRVISRDENGNLVSKNLHRLFPVSTDMVVIIDDRSDVWPRNRPNLIKVTPYDFFKGIGDINSSFLPKRQDILPGAPANGTNGSAPTTAKSATANDASNTASALDDIVMMSSGQDKALQEKQAAEQEKSLEKQIIDRPLLHMQEELDKEDGVTLPDESSDTPQPSHPVAERHHILRDDDDELVHIQKHLTKLHSTFYKLYDEKNDTRKADLSIVPDAGYLLDELKGSILRGVVIVLSGLVPLGVDVLHSELGRQIMSFGADLHTRISRRTTHLVVSTQRPRTEKLRLAAKMPSIKIVNQYWLADCLSQWKKLPEGPYLVPVHNADRKRSAGEAGQTEEVSDADEDENDSGLKIIGESGQGIEYEDDEEDEEEGYSEREGLVVDVDSVMPQELADGAKSPIDDLKGFDWEGVDDELAEFLGSDADDSDEDEDDEGEGDSEDSTRESAASGTKRRAEDDDEEGSAKRQRVTNGEDAGGNAGEASGSGAEDGDDFAGDLEADLLAELEAQENG
ncbi:related to FCP1 - TFIIF interacting component of CTD phosphatase [Cephalotrichum gorgonifer]|uniref:RNA polymerase II subunit A C-terminal domain phosphatase n=1 Tax=Cephalotrichum gorgonifer TaxID=2041049 RepID=A0AAE8N4N2_9PEZI|nr:related to FCP1 - TFIIF interacting component of CTD phosphatase [Cephalotrichum gorgonifer]